MTLSVCNLPSKINSRRMIERKSNEVLIQLMLLLPLFIPYLTEAALYVDVRKAVLVILVLLCPNVHAKQNWKVN